MKDLLNEPADYDELLILEEQLLATKLNAWTKIVSRAFPRFDSRKMINARNSYSYEPYISTLTIVNEKDSITQTGSDVLKAGYKITFGVQGQIWDCGRDFKAISTPSINIDQIILDEFEKCLLAARLKTAMKKTSRLTNHDFIHNATLSNRYVENDFREVNRRDANIDGYEHYSLAMHQEIYQELRKSPSEITRVYDCACEYDDVMTEFLKSSQNPDKENMADALYEFLFYMLRNLVSGKEFVDSSGEFLRNREIWLDALTYGSAEPPGPFQVKVNGEKIEASLAHVTYLCQKDSVMRAEFEEKAKDGDWVIREIESRLAKAEGRG